MHTTPSAAKEGLSPYAGMEQRHIKALAPEEINGLLEGKGMGFAMAAELNRFPGPRHVLDLSDALALSPTQHKETETLFLRMETQAKALGQNIVREEAALDRLFAEGTIDKSQLDRLTTNIAALRGQLRAVHLAAHLEMTALLTPDQVNRYQQLRGYAHQGAAGKESPHRHQEGMKHHR